MAKLTKTQIEAIVTKLRRDYHSRPKKKESVSVDDMFDANQDFIVSLIQKSNLPKELVKFVTSKKSTGRWESTLIQDLTSTLSDRPKLLKSLGCPYLDPDKDQEYERQSADDDLFNTLLEDFRFELVMAGTDDYKEYMDAFNAKVAKAFK